MARKQANTDPETLSGRHIYKDEKGRVLYYNPRTLTGYVIKSENVAKYRQLSSRFLIGFLGAIVGYLIFDQWDMPNWIGIIIGIGCWLYMEYQFRSVFLPSLVQIHNFVPKEKPSLLESTAKDTIGRLALKAALFFAFAILIMVDVYVYLETTPLTLAAFWAIAIVTTGIGCFQLYAISYQKKHPEILVKETKKGRKTK